MVKDLSKHTIMALVVLAIVVSLLGTFTVFNEVSNAEITERATSQTSTGQARLTIADSQTTQASTEGVMSITIVR